MPSARPSSLHRQTCPPTLPFSPSSPSPGHPKLLGSRHPRRPIYAQRISNHINSIMTLLSDNNPKGRLRARALSSTRALLAGASPDSIVYQGNWSSQTIFNNYYRVSTDTHTNFTFLVLGSTGSSSATLEPQSQDPQHEV
ncbi:hypothetical protein BGW37DRAFT_557641 [Umbelopsis sp. PMI_123]|nr:hypothetical protein BGW37DRAFT_557641 [Umbelopsis sp. PMI_123]